MPTDRGECTRLVGEHGQPRDDASGRHVEDECLALGRTADEGPAGSEHDVRGFVVQRDRCDDREAIDVDDRDRIRTLTHDPGLAVARHADGNGIEPHFDLAEQLGLCGHPEVVDRDAVGVSVHCDQTQAVRRDRESPHHRGLELGRDGRRPLCNREVTQGQQQYAGESSDGELHQGTSFDATPIGISALTRRGLSCRGPPRIGFQDRDDGDSCGGPLSFRSQGATASRRSLSRHGSRSTVLRMSPTAKRSNLRSRFGSPD